MPPVSVPEASVPRPGWLYKLWRASHPPIGERLDAANAWRAGEGRAR